MQGNRDRRSNQGPRPEWKEAKRFVDGKLAVVVSALQSFRPKYSIQVGSLRDDGSVTGHMPVQVSGEFIVKMTPIANMLSVLLEKAEEWVTTEMALRGDEYVQNRIEKEMKQASFGKLETRHTGKTAKKKAKRLGQAA